MLTVTLGLKVSKFFKSEQVEEHFLFRTEKSWGFDWLFLTFCQYSVSFVLDVVKILRASMSISAGMFETLFNSYSSVCLRLKGGESSSQFRWFTIAKIEL